MRQTLSSPLPRGRHRWGTPGLVHVSAYVTVQRRGILRSLFARKRRRTHFRHGLRSAVPAT